MSWRPHRWRRNPSIVLLRISAFQATVPANQELDVSRIGIARHPGFRYGPLLHREWQLRLHELQKTRLLPEGRTNDLLKFLADAAPTLACLAYFFGVTRPTPVRYLAVSYPHGIRSLLELVFREVIELRLPRESRVETVPE